MGFFGRRDPSTAWTREPGLRAEVDLDRAALCGVRLGARPADLSRLGAPTRADEDYAWPDLGIEARVKKGLLTAYVFTWPCAASFSRGIRGGMSAADLVGLLGEPWHRYADPDLPEAPLRMFYVTRLVEWEFEILASDVLHSLTLAAPPSLADPGARARLRVEKRWPPA